MSTSVAPIFPVSFQTTKHKSGTEARMEIHTSFSAFLSNSLTTAKVSILLNNLERDYPKDGFFRPSGYQVTESEYSLS